MTINYSTWDKIVPGEFHDVAFHPYLASSDFTYEADNKCPCRFCKWAEVMGAEWREFNNKRKAGIRSTYTLHNPLIVLTAANIRIFRGVICVPADIDRHIENTELRDAVSEAVDYLVKHWNYEVQYDVNVTTDPLEN